VGFDDVLCLDETEKAPDDEVDLEKASGKETRNSEGMSKLKRSS
jgi:hypothetical protein